MGLSCGATLARIFLVVLNITFLLLGIGLLVIGCMVKWGSTIIDQHMRPLLATVASGAVANIDINALFSNVAIAFIVIGAAIFVIGILGCCGACCKVRWMLLLYGIVVMLLFVAEVVCVALMFTMTAKIEGVLKTGLSASLKNTYKGSNATDVVSMGWNFVFIQFDCCGVTNYTELHSALAWERNYTVSGNTFFLETPITCCKIGGTFPNIVLPTDLACAVTPTPANSNYQTGCFGSLKKFLSGKTTIMIAVGVCLAVGQLAVVISAFCLFKVLGAEGKTGVI